MRFTIKGTLSGDIHTITWDNGQLIGLPSLINLIRIHSQNLSDIKELIGPVGGPYKSGDYLSDALTALFLLKDHVFDEVIEATGDLPVAPGAPQKAII